MGQIDNAIITPNHEPFVCELIYNLVHTARTGNLSHTVDVAGPANAPSTIYGGQTPEDLRSDLAIRGRKPIVHLFAVRFDCADCCAGRLVMMKIDRPVAGIPQPCFYGSFQSVLKD